MARVSADVERLPGLGALKKVASCLYVDNEPLWRDLGWTPPFTMQEGLRRTLAEGLATDARASKRMGVCLVVAWTRRSLQLRFALILPNSMIYLIVMTTTVTTKNMVSIPVELARMLGIKPGYTFDWSPTDRPEEIIVRVVPDRKALSRRLMGAGAMSSPGRSAVAELVQERAEDPA